MLRVLFRYVLPVAALMVTVQLYVIGRQEEKQTGIPVGSWDGPPPRPLEIAQAINIPAVIAALPAALLLAWATGQFDHPSRAHWHEVISYFYLAAFVLGQWALIGRWLNQWRISQRSSASHHLGRSRIVNVAGLIGSLFLVTFGIWRIVYTGWMSSWIPGAGIVVWGSIAAIALAVRLRRAHATLI